MNLNPKVKGLTLVELSITMAVISVVGLAIFSILNTGMVLGAKNSAVNTAHQQARTAMVQMLQDLHSAISLPYLVDATGAQVLGAGPAAGISFQEWSSGPHKLTQNAALGQNQIVIALTSGSGLAPVVGEHLILPNLQIEADITAVSGSSSSLTITLDNIYGPSLTSQEAATAGLTFPVVYPVHILPVAISGATHYSVVCFVTDRCAYKVANGSLDWTTTGPSLHSAFSVMGSDITNALPFSTPVTPFGALYYRFVAAINLSTADPTYNNRGFKSANILLNGQVPMKARLTTYQ